MLIKSLLYSIASIFLLTALCAVSSSTESKYEGLRKRYLTLRNTDPEIAKTLEWQELAEEMVGFVDRYPRYSNSPSLLFDASIVHEKLYQKLGDLKRVDLACTLLERLARDFPGHLLVDDGLIRRGDLLLYVLKDVDNARRTYQEVIDAYSNTDMFPVARMRLGKIESGEYLVEQELSTQREEVVRVIQRPAGKPVIVIDPGHGGEDFGAVGVGGMLEKDVALAIGIELEKELKQRVDAVVRLTRRSDIFVPLKDRTNLANDFEADLFLSLHANASKGGRASGFEVYYLDNHGDKASRKLAERENSSVRFEGPEGDLHYMLSDLIQGTKLDDSIALANTVYRETHSYLGKKWKISKGLGVKRAPFYVLVGAHMPCALVEMFFIDNKVDGKQLSNPKFRREIAKGIAVGVENFLLKTGKK